MTSPLSMPPALDTTIVEDGTGVFLPGNDVLHRLPGSEIHHRKVDAHLTRSCSSGPLVAIAKLALVVAAPTLGRVIIQDRASMIISCCNVLGCLATQVDDCETRQGVGAVSPLDGVTVA